ncbi:siderophore-interacting protein [Marinobacter sp. KMM 10035]|uniref:siderophore-interacting protein n=1 Tax=Marinobacter sp. KMM 10035 TaxID=3134034 RepID=UPI00397ADD18
MSKPAPRTLEVVRSAYITPNMLRLTLGGSGLADFPEDQESAYIKLIFPQCGEARPLMRTYTISGQRNNEIDVDFVLHAAGGPASAWAGSAKPGDQILVGGPGPKKLIKRHADWYLLVGDMTALPAIAVNLAQLPKDARGYVVIEVVSGEDIQPLQHPENIEVHWVVSATLEVDASALLKHVEQLSWLPGQPAVWAACEFHSMRALRAYFKQEREMAKSHLYISSYWKINSTEDQHKIAKRDDSQAVLA